VRGPRTGLLAPLRYRDYRLVAGGWLVSLLGDGVFRVAIALQVYEVDPDPRSFAAVGLVWALAQVAVLPLGGWITDRFPRRSVIVFADLWRAAAIGALGLLSVTGMLTIPYLLVIGACFGAGNAFFNPASTSLLPELLPAEDLPRANAFFGGAKPVMLYVLGPSLGALVIGLGEPGTAFLVDGGTFIVSAILVAMVSARSAPARTEAGRGFLAQVRDSGQGVRVVLATRWLWAGMLGATISGLAFHGPFEVLVPFLLIDDFGYSSSVAAVNLASIMSASGVGAVLVAWMVGRRGLPRRSVLSYYLAEGIALLALVVLGLMLVPWQGMIAGLTIGSMFALSEIVWTTNLQRWVPTQILGRVSSFDWMVGIGLAPMSFAIAGPLGSAYGARAVLVAAGVLGAVALFGLPLIRGARDPERFAAEAADVEQRILPPPSAALIGISGNASANGDPRGNTAEPASARPDRP
jgi:hypothetical protein